MERRELITVGGAAIAVALAGCTDGGDDNTADDGGSTDDNSGSTGDDGTENGGSDDTGEEQSGFQVRVEYEGDWSGSISAGGSARSVDGSGTEVLDIEAEDVNIVSANAQKQDDSSRELLIQILEDGEVVAEQSTTAEFGVAQVTHDTF